MNTKKKSFGLASLEKKYGALTVGRFLSSWRMSEGLSQKEFAKKIGMSAANLCDIEKAVHGHNIKARISPWPYIASGGHHRPGFRHMLLRDRKTMHNPPHPGEAVRELCLEPLGLTVTAAADALGVTRKTLSELLNGKIGISPEMAIRLSIAFNTSAESWMNQQMRYDLWKARFKGKKLKVKKLAA